ITIEVPSASDSGMLRFGFFTSPAVKVMLFHASAENSDPVSETQIAASRPNAVAAATPGAMGSNPRGCQKLPKLAEMELAFQPRASPSRINAASDPIFAVVKMF